MIGRNAKQPTITSGKSNNLKGLPKRVLALILCVALIVPLVIVTELALAAEEADVADNPIGSLENLYTREADENTMDSYVQANLGGLIYLQEHDNGTLDGVSTATVRNNYGTRYAGEVWADKSVFARYQDVIAQIRPFEPGHSYDNTLPEISGNGELEKGQLVKTIYSDYGSHDNAETTVFYRRNRGNDGTVTYTALTDEDDITAAAAAGTLYTTGVSRALQTLAHWVGVDAAIKAIDDEYFSEKDEAGNFKYDEAGNIVRTADALKSESNLIDLLAGGTLTSAQADALNAAVNDAIAADIAARAADNDSNNDYTYANDGDFDGKTLYLGLDTDGITTGIDMADDADFLHVFSALGSSEMIVGATPMDVVLVLDVSGSMGTVGGTGGVLSNNLIESAVRAVNEAIDTLMDLNINNRVGVVVYASRPAVLMELGRYWPFDTAEDEDGEYDVYVNYDTVYSGGTAVGFNRRASKCDERYYTYSGEITDVDLTIVCTKSEGGDAELSGYSGAATKFTDGKYDTENDKWKTIGNNTDMDSGVWLGLEMLATAEDTVVTIDNKPISRVPSLALLSDGDPQGMMAVGKGSYGSFYTVLDARGTGNELTHRWMETEMPTRWWEPLDPEKSFRLNYPAYNDVAVMFSTVMRICLMKAAVQNHYLNTARLAEAENAADLEQPMALYTIGIALGQMGNATGQVVATALLNPADEEWGFNYNNNKSYTYVSGRGSVENNSGTQSHVFSAYAAWEFWTKWEYQENLGGFTLNFQTNALTQPTGEVTSAKYRYYDYLVELLPEMYYYDENRAIRNNIYKYTWGTSSSREVVMFNAATGEVYLNENPASGFYYGRRFPQFSDVFSDVLSELETLQGANPTATIKADVFNDTIHTDKNAVGAWLKLKAPGTGQEQGAYNLFVTKQELIDCFPYTTQYLTADTAGELKDALATVIEKITTPVWDPVGGTNSAGVENLVTYSDPIGEYMTVDSVTDITLFGERYQVTPVVTGVPYDEAKKYAQNITTNFNTSEEKRDNTSYTVYQITGVYEKQADGTIADTATPLGENTTRYNRSYIKAGEEDGLEDEEKAMYQFDLVDDIHIWLEDTGKWRDSGTGGFIVDEGYGRALYINIGFKALPVQVVTVTMASDYDSPKQSHPREYTTNLNDAVGSTPLRVFYNVSLDKEYLRYMAGHSAKETNAKDYATGVSLSKVATQYLEKNTSYYKYDKDFGHYVETTADDTGAGRKVAFYSNYFTNNIYNEYPVMSDNTKTSRGNSDVTFSPSDDNQFYRFQKNRVLFLIPGADENFARPAEIDLGYLETLEGISAIAGKTYTSWNAAKNDGWDPTTVEGLLKILNKARAENHTYYSNYDCIAVTGAHDLTIKTNGTNSGTWLSNENPDGSFILDEEIDSDNWFYIIREFYYPVEFAADGVTATEVRARYMAIARKGSEFGSGVANSGGEMGTEVEWYYPGDGKNDEEKAEALAAYNTGGKNTWDFKNDSANHYNHPYKVDKDGNYLDNDGKSVDENGEKYTAPVIDHEKSGWYVSARPGGLRVGGMANFAGIKGYDIREGVGEGNFTKDDSPGGKIDQANITGTAKTFFLPTISTYTNPNSANRRSIVVNTYLGNNGRILVDDSILVVTKTVSTQAGETSSFEFEVEIEGFFGERGAVLITRDEFNPKLWRRRFDSIDVLTNNQRLLLGDDGMLAQVDENGMRVVAATVDYYGNSFTAENSDGKDANGNYVKYYYALKGTENKVIKYAVDEEGTLKKDQNGNLIEDDINGIIVPDYDRHVTGGVYYVYVSKNLRSSIITGYNDKMLRVFKANVEEADGVVELASGDIYGNKSLRGGRTYYVTKEQYETLSDEVRKSANVEGDTSGLDVSVNDTQKAFVFHIIDDNNSADDGYEAGDREFWINKVYLIPIGDVDAPPVNEETGEKKDWTAAFADYEAGPDDEDDWRAGYSKGSEVGIGGYTMLSQFKVAHIRTLDTSGNTTATELASNNDFYLESQFLTTKVKFEACPENKAHGHAADTYGIAKFSLPDGQGLGFNNIGNGNNYAVTEIISKDQDDMGIYFQQVDHVQDAVKRTRYVYSETGNFTVGTDVTPKLDNSPTHQTHNYWTNGLGKNVSIVQSCITDSEGRQYDYWYGGERVQGSSLVDLTANFSQTNRYTVVGDASLYEEGVHYVNYMPSISKQEFTPGAGEDVYVDDLITYTILWQNYEYDGLTGEAKEARVTITDPLDEGMDFVSAVFNPFHGNMAHVAEGEQGAENNFKTASYLSEYKYMLQLEDMTKTELEQLPSGTLEALQSKWKTGDLTLNAKEETGDDGKKKPAAVDISKTYKAAGNEFEDPVNGKVQKDIPRVSELTSKDDNDPEMTVNITYDPETHQVKWVIENAPSNTYGYVELTVRVNSHAVKHWDYDNGSEEEPDYQVVNRAGVQVADKPEQFTELVVNPTGVPRKTESGPGDGIQVVPGQKVDYAVDLFNPTKDPATVIIEDRLDPGVWFYMAGIASDNDNKTPVAEIVPDEEGNYTDYVSGAVWTAMSISGEDGIESTANGTPEGDGGHGGNTLEPLAFTMRVQDGNAIAVGDQITYIISWEDIPEDVTEVTITDILDPGLTFYSADIQGKSDPEVKYDTEVDEADGNITLIVTWTYGDGSKIVVKCENYQGEVPTRNPDGGDSGDIEADETTLTDEGTEAGEGTVTGGSAEAGEGIVTGGSAESGKGTVTDGDAVIGDGAEAGGITMTGEGTATRGYAVIGKGTVTDGDAVIGEGAVTDESTEAGEGTEDNKTITVDYAQCDKVTVTWELTQTATRTGEVSLVVTVNGNATDKYEYVSGEGVYRIEKADGEDNQVVNMAMAEVAADGTLYTQFTDLVVKELAEAGESPIGNGYPYEGNEGIMLTIGGGENDFVYLNGQKVGVTIFYYPDTHTIRWELTNVPAFYNGKVYFSVIVNSKADYKWINRGEDDWPKDGNGNLLPPEWSDNEQDNDYHIYNQTRISLDNGISWEYTNTIENPTRPEKKEFSPGNYEGAVVGDLITYTITWLNNESAAADVTVIDKLDPGLTYVDAGFMIGNVQSKVLPGCTAEVAAENGITTVTWTLEARPAGASGMVCLTVRVNEQAYDNWDYTDDDNPGDIVKGEGAEENPQVVNRAGVKVGNNPIQFTEVVKKSVEMTPPPGESPNPGEPAPPGESPNPSEPTPPGESPNPSEPAPPGESPNPSEPPALGELPDLSESLPPDTPKTGDESQLGLWVTLLSLSLAGVLGSSFYIVRKSKPSDPKGKEQK